MQDLKTEGRFTKSRAYLHWEPYEIAKKCQNVFAISFQYPPKRSISRVFSLDSTISRRLSRAMNGEIGGLGIQNRSGICIDQSFHSWRNICLLQETTLTTFVAAARHSHTHTTYKMACIASSFTGSVAALKASKVQVRARAHHRARRRARAAPTPAFFSRGIPRHLSRSRPPFPSYLERI